MPTGPSNELPDEPPNELPDEPGRRHPDRPVRGRPPVRTAPGKGPQAPHAPRVAPCGRPLLRRGGGAPRLSPSYDSKQSTNYRQLVRREELLMARHSHTAVTAVIAVTGVALAMLGTAGSAGAAQA